MGVGVEGARGQPLAAAGQVAFGERHLAGAEAERLMRAARVAALGIDLEAIAHTGVEAEILAHGLADVVGRRGEQHQPIAGGAMAGHGRAPAGAVERPHRLRVVAFDQDAVETYRGRSGGFGIREKSALLARGALGATDLAQALAFIARDGGKLGRVLVVGDGVVTAGAEDTLALREAVAKLAAHGVQRLDVLAEGGIRDDESLTALTRAGILLILPVLTVIAICAEIRQKLVLDR